MSNLGQAALIVVGTVVGTYFGNPQLGFVLGSLAGSALFPTQLPAGPRITDNRTTTATVGEPVPILFGTADVSGTVIWLAPYVETASEQGSKGGPEQKTYSYTQSIGIGLCERVDPSADPTAGAIGGISRIWENGTIVYDIRPQQPADSDTGSIAETDQQYQNRLTASAAYAETFTLYLGDELQMPDPTIEAIEGIGNAAPMRGLAYIVYPNRALLTAQGLRHPNFTFECYESGTGDCTESTQTSNEVLYPWDGQTNTLNTNTYEVSTTGAGTPNHIVYDDLGDCLGTGQAPYGFTLEYMGLQYNSSPPYLSQTGQPAIGALYSHPDPSTVFLHFSLTKNPTNGWYPYIVGHYPAVTLENTPGAQWWDEGEGGIVLCTGLPFSGPLPTIPGYLGYFGQSGPYYLGLTRDLVIQNVRSPGAPTDPCFGLQPAPGLPGFSLLQNGNLVKCNSWAKDTSQTWKVLQKFKAVGSQFVNTCDYPLGPAIPISDSVHYDDEAMWTAAYSAAVANGSMPAGLVYGVGYPVTQAFGYNVDLEICEGGGAGSSVAHIIELICKRAGLSADQIDTSDLSDIYIPGYSISSICDAADIISPLRSVAFFDCVESGPLLRFPTRGKEVVMTLTADQFGCYDGGTGSGDGSSISNVPPSISTNRADETTLPRSIRLHYKAVARDYQDGEEDSPFRLATLAVDDQDVSIPLCLGDVQAAKAAEIIWSDAWAAQEAQTLSIDQSLLQLEGGDCIGVPINNVIQRLRIVSDSNASAVLRQLNCVGDNEGSYISYAVATAPASQPQRLTFVGPSNAEYLDLPCLQDADSDPGFYVAAQRASDTASWKGATIYKSIDSGTTFQSQFSLTAEATIGALAAPVPASDWHTWDDETIITVNVLEPEFSFESRTDDAVLAGANAAAMGATGRWEIVQFANATQITATQWQLSRLLRGRRGTEHVLGLSVLGDSFVMVSTGDLARLVLQTSEIGAARIYKDVSIGAAYSSGTDTGFTGLAVALRCFSPVWPAAMRVTDGDISISWIRRSRIGRTLTSGMDIPVGETTLSFSIDIIDTRTSPSSVIRTLTSGSESVLYTTAQQMADFGSSMLTHVAVAIYQISATTGRGYPCAATLEVT